jgi:predicted PurR-regulated permease PerM
MDSHAAADPSSPRSKDEIMDVLVRAGLIAFLVILCARVFAPFMPLVLWSLILAIALAPWHHSLATRFGGRQGLAASALVLVGLLLMGIPLALLSDSFTDQLHGLHTAFEGDTLALDPPPESVAQWPLIGERLHGAWTDASRNLPAFLEARGPQLASLSKSVLSAALSALGSCALLLGALVVAGVMLAWRESGSRALLHILRRIAGPDRGPKLQALTAATVRSVAGGVIGVAFLQSLLLGVGFLAAGIPAAGVLAALVLLLGILQLPAAIILLPALGWLWGLGDGSTLANTGFTIYLLLAGLSDNVLKPMLLGRGVDAPMPIILIGALGGMATAGLLGLFLGAVLMAVGYRIFMDWVAEGAGDEGGEQAPSPGDPEPAAS